jgi:hypothetical protein
MAKRNSTRRKARKPKFIEVEGHQLTKPMHADYLRRIESRTRTNKGAAAWEIERMALDDFLSDYRPSHKIKGQLSELCHTTTRLGIAVGVMDNYTFYTVGPASIRSAGCKLLQEMALELYNASAKLTAIVMNVEAEKTTKLQDWLAGDERVAQIGRVAEVADGG